VTSRPQAPHTFTEQEIVATHAGAITSTAAYITHRHGSGDRIIDAVTDQLDGVGLALLDTLTTAADQQEADQLRHG